MQKALAGATMLALVSAPALAVDVSDFQLATTRALVNLCSAPATDPLIDQARTACYSYLAGTVDFYRALTAPRGEIEPFVCPSRELTRTEVAIVLVDWAANHPEHLDELPVEGVVRAAVEAFPCDSSEGSEP